MKNWSVGLMTGSLSTKVLIPKIKDQKVKINVLLFPSVYLLAQHNI